MAENSWDWLGEEGERIREVLAAVDEEKEIYALEAWKRYLERLLIFPFDAEIMECSEGGPLEVGDRVSVKKIDLVDEFYGIIMELRRRRRKYHIPLCDLEVIDHSSVNYQPVKDYGVWFANRC